MQRTWLWSLLCSGVLAAGCGDDDDLRAPVDAGSDASQDAGRDARAPGSVQIDNPGAACADDPAACRGPGATCQRSFGQAPLTIDLPGGYCTASCTSSVACGSGGGCPLGDLSAEVPGLGDIITSMVPLASTCWDKCSRVGASDPCRQGYVCRSIRDLVPPMLLQGSLGIGLLLLGPASVTPYCMPPFDLDTLFDGGVPSFDGGVLPLTPDGGMDAGM